MSHVDVTTKTTEVMELHFKQKSSLKNNYNVKRLLSMMKVLLSMTTFFPVQKNYICTKMI